MRNRLLIITGGTSKIGQEIITLAFERNYQVVFTYNSDKEAASYLENLSEDRIIKGYKVNLHKEEAISDFYNQIEKDGFIENMTYGYLVNAAGIVGGKKDFCDYSQQALKDIFNINFFSAYFMIVHYMKFFGMKNHKPNGAIVNLGSQASVRGGNRIAPYACSKSALSCLSTSLCRELAKEKTRINTVSPGVIESGPNHKLSQEDKDNIAKSTPLGRLGSPKEVAATIMWLLSDEASFITGADIPVNGGR